MNQKIAILSTLLLVQFIDVVGGGIVFAILAPLFVAHHDGILNPETSDFVRNFYYGLVIAIFFISTFFGAPFMGDLSDKVGRKKILMICLFGVAIGFFLCALGIYFKNIFLLILGRMVNGFAAGSQTISQAAIIDISSDEEKAYNLSLITLAMCMGFIIGPLFSGILSTFVNGALGYILPFLIAGGVALLNAGFLWISFQETFQPEKRTKINLFSSFKAIQILFEEKKLWLLGINFFFAEFSWSVYFQYIGLYLSTHFNYSTKQIGIYLATNGALFALSMLLIFRVLSKFLNLKSITIVTLILMAFGGFFCAYFHSPAAYWCALVPFSIGGAVSYLGFMNLFSNQVSRQVQGRIMGTLTALTAVSWGITGLTLSVMIEIGGKGFPFWLAFASAMIATLVSLKI